MYLESLLDTLKWGLNLNVTIIDFFQMLILTGVFYYLSKTFYRTRAWVLIKGLLVIGIIYLLVYATHMTVIQNIMESLFSVLIISIVIMFQPDLQHLVESVGKRSMTATISSILKRQSIENTWSNDKTIYEIVSACQDMSEVKTGALIVLERGIPLKEYIDSGISVKADVSSQLLINIFEKNTPLHDGAVVIRHDRIEAATCYLPLTNNESVDKHLGTRHRAAIGISEATDCIVIVVSEETGAMSICVDGEIQHNIDRSKLSDELHKFCKKSDDKVIKAHEHNTPLFLKIASPVLGVLTCLFILNVNDPVITRRIDNVPVTIENEDILISKNQSYTIESGDEISVYLKGHRSVVESLKVEDIWATANIEELSIVNAVPINVAIADRYAYKVEISTKTNVLKIALENLTQVEIPIEVVVEGTSNSKLMVVDVVGNKSLTVTGSESVIKTLEKAVVVVDITGKTSNFTDTKEAVVYDKNGNVVSATKLKLNSQVPIKGTAYATKTVPLKIQLSKTPSNVDYFYELNDFETEIANIQIAGHQNVLDTIETFDLIISPDEGLETITTMVFKLINYLPEGTYLGPSQNPEVSVTVNITKYQKVRVGLTKENISILGGNDKIETTITGAPLALEVIVDVSKISADAISLTLLNPTVKIQSDLGEYSAPLTIAEIEGVKLNSNIVVTYRNIEKEV